MVEKFNYSIQSTGHIWHEIYLLDSAPSSAGRKETSSKETRWWQWMLLTALLKGSRERRLFLSGCIGGLMHGPAGPRAPALAWTKLVIGPGVYNALGCGCWWVPFVGCCCSWTELNEGLAPELSLCHVCLAGSSLAPLALAPVQTCRWGWPQLLPQGWGAVHPTPATAPAVGRPSAPMNLNPPLSGCTTPTTNQVLPYMGPRDTNISQAK